MPAPLSLDLRERLVEAVENGSSIRQAALRYSVSPSAAIKLMQRVETTGSLEPEPSGGRKLLLLEPRFGALDDFSVRVRPVLVVLSDSFGDGPSELEHLVENIDTDHRLAFLVCWVTRAQAGTDDPFVTRHRRFDQGATIIA